MPIYSMYVAGLVVKSVREVACSNPGGSTFSLFFSILLFFSQELFFIFGSGVKG